MSTETATAETLDIAPRAGEQEGRQYLTFDVAGETYGVDILRVQEIRGWEPVTRIPNAHECVRGVLNLRGAIVPVYDLRLMLELDWVAYDPETVVIIIKVRQGDSDKHVGIIVDAVSDVINELDIEISNSPSFGEHIKTEFIASLATEKSGGMVMLLDADRLPIAGAGGDDEDTDAD